MARYNATFTSVWDGGLEINARCYVSKRNHSVLRVGKNDASLSIEENLDILEEEYVTLDTGEKYKAMSEEAYDRLLLEYDWDEDEEISPVDFLQRDYGIVYTY